MNEVFISIITQIITTLLTVSVTVLVAYLTYYAQRKKENEATRRLQNVNCRSALELFNAYISNLIFFVAPRDIQLETEHLCICIEKMKLTDQYLSELTEVDFPDSFIESFHLYRLKLAFQRIILENKLKNVNEATVSSSLFDDMDTMELITTIRKTISEYSEEEKPEKI